MGRKRSGTWQYLYCCAAVLITAILASCAPPGNRPAEPGAAAPGQGRQFLGQIDFDEAMRQNREMLERFPHRSPGDTALLNIARLYIHHANPKRDPAKALHYFTRLKNEFPGSALSDEAMTWILVLQTPGKAAPKEIEATAKKIERPQVEENAELQRGRQLLGEGDFAGALRQNQAVLDRFPDRPPGDTALFNLGLIHIHHANPKRDTGQALHSFSRLVREFPDSTHLEEAKIWVGILESLEKARQIDIEIEEKKRELRG